MHQHAMAGKYNWLGIWISPEWMFILWLSEKPWKKSLSQTAPVGPGIFPDEDLASHEGLRGFRTCLGSSAAHHLLVAVSISRRAAQRYQGQTVRGLLRLATLVHLRRELHEVFICVYIYILYIYFFIDSLDLFRSYREMKCNEPIVVGCAELSVRWKRFWSDLFQASWSLVLAAALPWVQLLAVVMVRKRPCLGFKNLIQFWGQPGGEISHAHTHTHTHTSMGLTCHQFWQSFVRETMTWVYPLFGEASSFEHQLTSPTDVTCL